MAALPPFAVPQTYNTPLNPLDEAQFRNWTQSNQVPFDPNVQQSDYDMRGFYRALQQGNPVAQSAVDPYDNRMHYPDYWKTPQHQTFSAESQWAGQNTPQWINDAQLAAPSGRILFDAKKGGSPANFLAKALQDY